MQREVGFGHAVQPKRGGVGWRLGQGRRGEQVQDEEHNLVSGGLLSVISPLSETFK
jgi:hypothetical protein